MLVAESDIEVAKAQLSDARSQYDYEKAILDQHTLLAPFDALVDRTPQGAWHGHQSGRSDLHA